MSGAMTVQADEAEMRVRIAHVHTLKEGWRCNETTTEWSGIGSPNLGRMQAAMEHAYDLGKAEADRRNAIES